MRGRALGEAHATAGLCQQEMAVQFLDTVVNDLNGLVWGPPMLVLILGTGLFLMLRLGFMPLTKIAAGFRLAWRSRARNGDDTGENRPLQALIPSLDAPVGTGNIEGDAPARFLGGRGTLVWSGVMRTGWWWVQ